MIPIAKRLPTYDRSWPRPALVTGKHARPRGDASRDRSLRGAGGDHRLRHPRFVGAALRRTELDDFDPLVLHGGSDLDDRRSSRQTGRQVAGVSVSDLSTLSLG